MADRGDATRDVVDLDTRELLQVSRIDDALVCDKATLAAERIRLE